MMDKTIKTRVKNKTRVKKTITCGAMALLAALLLSGCGHSSGSDAPNQQPQIKKSKQLDEQQK